MKFLNTLTLCFLITLVMPSEDRLSQLLQQHSIDLSGALFSRVLSYISLLPVSEQTRYNLVIIF
jgi:hypothetical protein